MLVLALKKFNFEEEKVLILISSLMVWNKTPPKMREVGENGTFIDPNAPPAEEAPAEVPPEGAPEESKDDSNQQPSIQVAPAEEKPKKYVQLPYVEEDFRQRVPSEEYEEIKRIEDEVLAFKKDNVRIYILASGIMYGAGECILESHFKRAWLQEPPSLPYLGVGKNLVPTIHVKDLARMVKKVYESKPPLPDKQYIFAVDNTRKPTQKRLIASISNGIGTGLLESVDYPDPDHMKKAHPKKTPLHLLETDWRIALMLNLRIKPSSLFVAGGEGDEGAGDVDFNWHCKAGLALNI